MEGLAWRWIALLATVPPFVALLVALPIWRLGAMILGNIAGSMVIFGSALALILREHTVLDRAVQACLAAGDPCWPEPSAFTRYAIYAFISVVEVIALFIVSLVAERRMRRGDYSPEWRR